MHRALSPKKWPSVGPANGGQDTHFSTRASDVEMRFLFSLMNCCSVCMRRALEAYILSKISLSSCRLQLAVHTPPGHLRQHVGH